MRADDQLRDVDAGLFDHEERVIAGADAMIGDLQAAVRGVDRLVDAYRQSYREQRRLLRLSDRMQLDLHVANQRLEEQTVRLRELNLELAAEIEQRMQLTEELKRLVITDPLTGLASRRHLFDQAGKEIARADRSHAPLSILMFDLDLFKGVNDTHGHAAGDAVLCHFAELCKARFRTIDLVGRIGGEEFVVLLPETDLGGAELVANRLREAVASQPIMVGQAAIALTVSAGVTQYRSTDQGLDRALQRADAALYDAKHQGRNRVVVRIDDKGRVMKKLALHLGLLAASLIVAVTGANAQTPASPAASKKLIVGVENTDYAPISTAENGVYGGLSRDVFDAFSADTGYALEFRPLPVPRLYATLFAGELDFKFPDDPAWDAANRTGKALVYSKQVFDYIDGTIVRADRLGQPIETVKTLGSLTGFSPLMWLDRIRGGQVKLTENASLSPLLQQVIAKRIDAAYANVAVARHRLNNDLKQPGAVMFDPSLPYVRDGYRMSTIKHPEVIAVFDAWIAKSGATIARLKAERGIVDDLPK